jgi:hypothetical protein
MDMPKAGVRFNFVPVWHGVQHSTEQQGATGTGLSCQTLCMQPPASSLWINPALPGRFDVRNRLCLLGEDNHVILRTWSSTEDLGK